MSRRFLTIVLFTCSLTVAVFPALAANESNYTYLALGDSVSFGLNLERMLPMLMNPPLPPNPDQFFGYPEIVAQIQHLAQSKKMVNASCPGETSGSFLDIRVPDGGCNSPHPLPAPLPPFPPFKQSPGLHVAYRTSQKDFAVSQLIANKHINLVTLGIGGDDLLMLQDRCQNQNATPFQTCVINGLLGEPQKPGVLDQYRNNLIEILTAIRVNAGYNGTLVLVTYYSPSNDPLITQAVAALNTVMVQVGSQFGVKIAHGFEAFQLASAPFLGDPCAAELLNPNPFAPPTCDVHPSPKGSAVLADAVLAAIGDKH